MPDEYQKKVILEKGKGANKEAASISPIDLGDNKKKYGLNLNMNNDYIKHYLRSKMMIFEDKDRWTGKINRIGHINPYYAFGPTKEFLFFVKPELHITQGFPDRDNRNKMNTELANIPYWRDLRSRRKRVINQLSRSAAADDNPFSLMLTNSVTGSLDLPGVSAETIETSSNMYGTNIEYRGSSYKSDEGFDFSLQFMDNPDLEIYHFFKAYDEYEKLKARGLVTPPGGSENPLAANPYRVNKILYDQMGIYKFILADDMETILYYAYICGCFPKSVPRDSFDEISPGFKIYNTEWHGQFIEDNDPSILAEFNRVSLNFISSGKGDKSNLEEVGMWSNKYGEINGGWRDLALVVEEEVPGSLLGRVPKLKWYDFKS